jgi:predicted phage terminase large subunit-like protein
MNSGRNLDSIKPLVEEIGKLSLTEFETLWLELKNDSEDAAEDFFYLRCATDLELFTVSYFPHYCQYPFNQFHRDDFDSISFGERAIRRVRAAPRGYAKSTLKALIKPVHDVCYGLESFIVVISNTQDQANAKLKDIRTEVLTNAALISDYGIHFPRKNPGETSYEVHCNGHKTKFQAFGAGVEIRGIRYGSERPSKIVCDDSEHSDEVHNEELRQKYEDWYFQVVSNIGNERTNIEFIGTVLHNESLLVHLLRNPAYDGKLYKAVISWSEREDLWEKWRSIYTNLDNPNRLPESDCFYKENEPEMMRGAKVLWPEKESYLWLMKEMVEKGKRNFLKEKQNEPVTVDDALFEKIHWYKEVDKGIIVESTGAFVPWEYLKHAAYGTLDPATGQTRAKRGKGGDYSVILTGFQDPKGRLLVHHDWTKRAPPTSYITELFELHDQFNYSKFGVETNLYRNLLLPNIIAEKKRREQERKDKKVISYEIKLPFYDIENTDNKEKRIYTLEPKVTHGWILFNRGLSKTFMNMIEAFPKADHDDGPDCLEMLWSLMNNRYKASTLSVQPMGGR